MFFSGKGNIGKTTMASATAVYQSQQGKKKLLVSTDPAGNIGDIFEGKVGIETTQVSTNFFIAQMDSDAITDAYKERMLEPLSLILDGAMFEQVKEEFNGGCSVEIATFDKFTDYLEENDSDLIIFDTAPTGHTLRCLELPFEYKKQIYIKLKGDKSEIQNSSKNNEINKPINRLKNPEQTTFFLVVYPEFTPIHEGNRAMMDLERAGINVQGVFLNHILNSLDCKEGFAKEGCKLQQFYLNKAKEMFLNETLFPIPLQDSEIIGLDVLKTLSDKIFKN